MVRLDDNADSPRIEYLADRLGNLVGQPLLYLKALGENIDMMIPDNQKDQHWEGYDRVLESGVTKYAGGDLLTVSALKADGSRIGVEMSVTPLAEDGATTAIGVVVRPVRRAARQ